jgi:ketosteroid isomerase-like protein
VVLQMLDVDVTWRAPLTLPHGGEFSGRDAVGGFFQGLGETWDGLTLDLEDVVAGGDRVVALARIGGTLRTTGEQTGYSSAHCWTLRDGAVVKFDEYVDTPLSLPAAADRASQERRLALAGLRPGRPAAPAGSRC